MEPASVKRIGIWRLGGAALVVGGALWFLASLFQLGGEVGLVASVGGPGIILIGLGHLAIAFSGWSGDRRDWLLAVGTMALVVAAAGWVFFGAVAILTPIGIEVAVALVRILTLAAEVVAAVAIFSAGAAGGAARWVLLVPAGWMVAARAIEIFSFIDPGWNTLILSATFLVTGLSYALLRLTSE